MEPMPKYAFHLCYGQFIKSELFPAVNLSLQSDHCFAKKCYYCNAEFLCKTQFRWVRLAKGFNLSFSHEYDYEELYLILK